MDVIAFFHRGHAGPGLDDDARALVTKNGREQTFRIGAGQGEFISVTDTGRFDLDQDLAGARTVELDGGNFEGLAGCKGDGGANIHDIVLG
jgi:hypothetical protein